MIKMATKKADVKQVRKAGELALVKFPKTELRNLFESMGGNAQDAENATLNKAEDALQVCACAERFRDVNKANGAPCDVIAKGFREGMKALAIDLAANGNKFAKTVTAKDGTVSGQLTGYGNNVLSIACGVIEEDVLLDCAPDIAKDAGCEVEAGSAFESYRDVRKVVEAIRAVSKRERDPDAAALADSKAKALEAWADLKAAVFGSGDAGLVDGLTGMLEDAHKAFEMALAAQNAIEDEAEAEAA